MVARGYDCRTVALTIHFSIIPELGHNSEICAFCNKMQITNECRYVVRCCSEQRAREQPNRDNVRCKTKPEISFPLISLKTLNTQFQLKRGIAKSTEPPRFAYFHRNRSFLRSHHSRFDFVICTIHEMFSYANA